MHCSPSTYQLKLPSRLVPDIVDGSPSGVIRIRSPTERRLVRQTNRNALYVQASIIWNNRLWHKAVLVWVPNEPGFREALSTEREETSTTRQDIQRVDVWQTWPRRPHLRTSQPDPKCKASGPARIPEHKLLIESDQSFWRVKTSSTISSRQSRQSKLRPC